MKLVKCSKPKNYFCTNIYFSNIKSAESYADVLTKDFLSKKASKLEHPDLSKRVRKNIQFSKPNKYLLTKVGNQYLLWEKMN